jgi:2-hydroxy-3-oxopropionate reductase
MDSAASLDAPVPLTAAVMDILQTLRSDGLALNDHSAIIRYYEKLANLEVRKD